MATTTRPSRSRCSWTAGCRSRTWSATGSRRSRARSPRSIVVLIAYDDNAVANTTTQASDVWAAIVVEVVFTAVFIAVILDSTRAERAHGTALLAIPLTLVAIHVAAIPISGASVNPARSIGPALVGTEFHDLWIYLIAPPIGAVLGWLAHRVVVLGDTSLRPVEASREGAAG